MDHYYIVHYCWTEFLERFQLVSLCLRLLVSHWIGPDNTMLCWRWPWSSTCPLTSFFWLLSHVIYLKLTKVLYECLLSQAEWWVAELLFLSLNNWGLNFLQNKCSQSSQIYLSPEKLRKVFTFQSCKFLNDKIDQKINFAKLPIAK